MVPIFKLPHSPIMAERGCLVIAFPSSGISSDLPFQTSEIPQRRSRGSGTGLPAWPGMECPDRIDSQVMQEDFDKRDLNNPNLQFTPNEQKKLQQQFNRKDEKQQ